MTPTPTPTPTPTDDHFVERIVAVVHEGAVTHAQFRETNGKDVDYFACIRAGLFSAANQGLIQAGANAFLGQEPADEAAQVEAPPEAVSDAAVIRYDPSYSEFEDAVFYGMVPRDNGSYVEYDDFRALAAAHAAMVAEIARLRDRVKELEDHNARTG